MHSSAPAGRSSATDKIKSASTGTRKTDMGPWLKGKAYPRYAEKCSCQTSRSEYSLCGGSDRVPLLAQRSKDCSPPRPSPCPIVGNKPAPDDSPDTETRSSPSRIPDWTGESA